MQDSMTEQLGDEPVVVTRADAVETTPVREELLNLAPQREGDFFRVPKILGA